MGFLDHSTNNIIVDAVLTAEGRAKLAAGDLDINSYGFTDEEVDYTIIKKYGTVVGKEKIEKNTPILEARTDGSRPLSSALYTDTSGTEIIFTAQSNGFQGDSVTVTISVDNNTGTTIEAYYDPDVLTLSSTSSKIVQVQVGSTTATFVFELVDDSPEFTTTTVFFERSDTGQVISVAISDPATSI